jgi:hypothetical protein
LSKKIEHLLNDLCIDLGFCIPPEDIKRITEAGSWEADNFACQVLIAEGMNPEYEKQWRSRIRNKFVEKFGNELSS